MLKGEPKLEPIWLVFPHSSTHIISSVAIDLTAALETKRVQSSSIQLRWKKCKHFRNVIRRIPLTDFEDVSRENPQRSHRQRALDMLHTKEEREKNSIITFNERSTFPRCWLLHLSYTAISCMVLQVTRTKVGEVSTKNYTFNESWLFIFF